MSVSYKAIDAQVDAVDAAIEKARNSADGAERLQRLYLKRQRLQEKSFKAFQKQLKARP